MTATLVPKLAISGYLVLFIATFVLTEVFVAGLVVSIFFFFFFLIFIVFVLKVVVGTNSATLGILFLMVVVFVLLLAF